jgi:hypothetical protein
VACACESGAVFAVGVSGTQAAPVLMVFGWWQFVHHVDHE